MAELPPKTPLADIESDLFGAIFGFHTKVTTMVRGSSLDDEKLSVVTDRIKTLLKAVTVGLNGSQQVSVTKQLESAYDEVERLVNHLLEGGKKS